MKECQMFKRGLADSIIRHLSRRLHFRTIFQANIKSKALLGKHDTNIELKPTAVKSFENLSEIFFKCIVSEDCLKEVFSQTWGFQKAEGYCPSAAFLDD